MRSDKERKKESGVARRRCPRPAAFFLAGLLFFAAAAAGTVAGKDLPEYRRDVSAARQLVLRLLYPEPGQNTGERRREYVRETVREIRQKIPPTEKIAWDDTGASVETRNGWLATKLNAFEDAPPESPARRELLIEIEQRLSAIEQKTEEAVAAAETTGRAKDEDKQKLAEILRRPEYQKPEEQEESLFQQLWNYLLEILGRVFPRIELSEASGSGVGAISFVLQIIIGAVILGILGFLAYRFAPFIKRRFKRKKNAAETDRVILGEEIPAERDAADLYGEAERLARAGDLRGAIRKGYIALLCDLSDRRIIGLSRHKTNRDYLRDVRRHRRRSDLYREVSDLTLSFERHWYGSERPGEADWENFRSGCRKAIADVAGRKG